MNDTLSAARGRPTLIVGLGGTGVSVAQHFKRRLAETVPRDRIPTFVRILAMDADQLPNRRPQLEPYEFVDLTGQLSVILSDVRHRGALPECRRWIPKLEGYRHLGQSGVGGVRPLGRLLFHRWREPRVRPAFIDALRSITDRRRSALEVLDRGRSPDKRSRVDIHCVFSLCGGVGAGVFLDTALYLRKWATDLFEGEYAPSLIAHAVLPEVFFAKQVREDLLKANAYAALTELDAFMEADFPDFYLQDGYPLQDPQPVFDECNLLSGVTEDGSSEPDDLFQDIAECIRLRSVTEFQQAMEVGLTNRASQNRGTADGADGRTNAYSTYGIAALRANQELLTDFAQHLFISYQRLDRDDLDDDTLAAWILAQADEIVDSAVTMWERLDLVDRPSNVPDVGPTAAKFAMGHKGDQTAATVWKRDLARWTTEISAGFMAVEQQGLISLSLTQAIPWETATLPGPVGPRSIAALFHRVGERLYAEATRVLSSDQEAAPSDPGTARNNPSILRSQAQTRRDAALAHLASFGVPEDRAALAPLAGEYARMVRADLSAATRANLAASAVSVAQRAQAVAGAWTELHRMLDRAVFPAAGEGFNVRGYGPVVPLDESERSAWMTASLLRLCRTVPDELRFASPEVTPRVIAKIADMCVAEASREFQGKDMLNVHRLLAHLPEARRGIVLDQLWSWAHPRCTVTTGHQATGKMGHVDCVGLTAGSMLFEALSNGHKVEAIREEWADHIPLIRSVHGFPITEIARLDQYRHAFKTVTTADRQEVHLFTDPDLSLYWPLPGLAQSEILGAALFSLGEALELYSLAGDGYEWQGSNVPAAPDSSTRYRDEMFRIFMENQNLVALAQAAWEALSADDAESLVANQIAKLRQRITGAEEEDTRDKRPGRKRELERGIRQLRAELRALCWLSRDPGDPI